jgi:hypothetical protein
MRVNSLRRKNSHLKIHENFKKCSNRNVQNHSLLVKAFNIQIRSEFLRHQLTYEEEPETGGGAGLW